MNTIMTTYKGYHGTLTFDDEAETLVSERILSGAHLVPMHFRSSIDQIVRRQILRVFSPGFTYL